MCLPLVEAHYLPNLVGRTRKPYHSLVSISCHAKATWSLTYSYLRTSAWLGHVEAERKEREQRVVTGFPSGPFGFVTYHRPHPWPPRCPSPVHVL